MKEAIASVTVEFAREEVRFYCVYCQKQFTIEDVLVSRSDRLYFFCPKCRSIVGLISQRILTSAAEYTISRN